MKQRLARVVGVSLGLASVFLLAQAQTKPDINGVWRMNAEQSRFLGSRGAPKDLVIRFEEQGRTLRELLTVVNSSSKSTVILNYVVDGRETVNNVDGEEIRSTANWRGSTLVLERKDKGGTFTREIAFSDDRKKMTVSVHDSNPEGETDDLIVLERQ